jgi:ketosteroid isomerase-like protein
MMASQNVELVRSIFAAWERGEFGLADFADADLEFVRADGPAPGSWRGFASIARAMREALSAWDDFRLKAEEYRELDEERVLVFVTVSGRGKRSGIDAALLRANAAEVLHLRDGKVTRIVTYYDRDRALAELGIARESPASERKR